MIDFRYGLLIVCGLAHIVVILLNISVDKRIIFYIMLLQHSLFLIWRAEMNKSILVVGFVAIPF